MLFDVYMIILTGFAIFGFYSFFDMIFKIFVCKNSPKSITVLKASEDSVTMQKVKYIENTLPNNEIIFFAPENFFAPNMTNVTYAQDIEKYIYKALFIK